MPSGRLRLRLLIGVHARAPAGDAHLRRRRKLREHRHHHLAIDLRRVVAAVLGDAEQHRRHRPRVRPALRIGKAEIVLHQGLGLLARHLQPRRGGARGRFQRSADVVGDDVLRLELRARLHPVPVIENLLHQPRQPHQRLRPLLPERLRPGVARAVAPGADVELVERIGARRPSAWSRARGLRPCRARPTSRAAAPG